MGSKDTTIQFDTDQAQNRAAAALAGKIAYAVSNAQICVNKNHITEYIKKGCAKGHAIQAGDEYRCIHIIPTTEIGSAI